jgi:hypothetical protein
MTTEWLQAQLIAFSLEQSDSKDRLAEKYAKIIMKRVERNPDQLESDRIQQVIDAAYARHGHRNPAETAII